MPRNWPSVLVFREYQEEREKVVRSQGLSFPYSFGLHLANILVAWSNPDLKILHLRIPLTKKSLDRILGYETNGYEYWYYFSNLVRQQAELIVVDKVSFVLSDFDWRHQFQSFFMVNSALDISAVYYFTLLLDSARMPPKTNFLDSAKLIPFSYRVIKAASGRGFSRRDYDDYFKQFVMLTGEVYWLQFQQDFLNLPQEQSSESLASVRFFKQALEYRKIPAKYEEGRRFDERSLLFRVMIGNIAEGSPLSISVDRANIIETAISSMAEFSVTDFKKKPKFIFGDENGIDAGGLTRYVSQLPQ